jgi:hypothetical protein
VSENIGLASADGADHIDQCDQQLGLLAADTSINIANVNLVGLAQTGLEYL